MDQTSEFSKLGAILDRTLIDVTSLASACGYPLEMVVSYDLNAELGEQRDQELMNILIVFREQLGRAQGDPHQWGLLGYPLSGGVRDILLLLAEDFETGLYLELVLDAPV